MTYTIYVQGADPSTAVPLTSSFTSETPGTYVIVATATDGFTLTGERAGWTDTVHTWTVTVADSSLCNLPTQALFTAGASGSPQTCAVDGSTNAGFITLTHLADETGEVTYTVTNDATSVSTEIGATKTKVDEAPGNYTVTAAAVNPTDGIQGANVFHVTVDASTVVCSELKTLALTGGTAGIGLSLAGGMLFLGFAGIYMRRRFGRSAE